MKELCEKNNYHPLITADLEELIKKTKRTRRAIVDVILLCDQAHRKFIKEAMELGAYASILSPYEEWEVLTIIRNILTVKRKRRPKKSRENKII
jgi:AmiR/NasT family two-component response regulator